MAAANNILSKKNRKDLAPRREPYWSRIAAGCHLGYRKLSEGDGTWIARWRDDEGKQHYRALGHFDDYDEAQKDASAWFRQNTQGARPEVTTVEAVCKAYVGNRRTEKGESSAKDAEGRFRRFVYGKVFGRIPIDRLQTKDVRKWRDDRVPSSSEEHDDDAIRRAKDSANRDLATLKAALNFALHERWVATDSGWKTVKAFEDVGERRNHFLSEDERKALLDKCADDLRQFVTALLLTGARPGEIAALNAADFDKKLGTLALNGKTGRRTVSLSSAATAFFKEQSKSKIGSAPMLTRADGARWDKDSWKKPFKDAAKAAGLPADVVLYSLRHTAISEMIAAGIDTFIVAKLAGTSTDMIDKHYGHLHHDKTRARLDSVKMI